MFAGCLASDAGAPAAKVAARNQIDRSSVTVLAQPSTTTTRLAATTVAPKSRPTSAAPVVARTSPVPGTPWTRYNDQLTGGAYVVARALGSGVSVSPSPGAAPAATLANPLPSGAPRVLLVVHDGGDWLQVLLPVRPNGSVGWVPKAEVSLSSVHYRVEIDRGAHRMRVFDASESIIVDEPVAVGKPSTPTPNGQFFTTELLQPPNPAGAYGPYAFTLSAYSEVYQTFGSGDGAVGVHGTNEPGSIGQNVSHGCVRLRNDAITRLAGMLPLGTPVFIR